MKLKEICQKCVHKETCTHPCRPVELHLAEGNQGVFEKRYIDPASGRQMTVLYPTREKRETSMIDEFKETGIPADKVQRTFSTLKDSPFRHFEPSLKQTGIFIDRFFNKYSNADLAVKYDVREKDAAEIYRRAVQRIMKIIMELDARKSRKRRARYLDMQAGTLSDPHRWFLMARVLGMSASEISEFEGMDPKNSLVRMQLQRITNQLAAGEKNLIEFTPEESERAQACLERQRRQRKDRRRIRRKNK